MSLDMLIVLFDTRKTPGGSMNGLNWGISNKTSKFSLVTEAPVVVSIMCYVQLYLWG